MRRSTMRMFRCSTLGPEYGVVSGLAFPFPDELIEAIAERVAELLAEREPPADRHEVQPYFNVSEAAAYLRCDRQRVYDLLSSGRLSRIKDGARTLVERAELERYLAVDTQAATPLATRARGVRR
jgi:excisionase family DNA binding protein